MFLEKYGNSGLYLALYTVRYIHWDKKKKIRIEFLDGKEDIWTYPNVQKAQDDIDIIERIIKKSIYFDD